MKHRITKGMAKEFMRDLRGTLIDGERKWVSCELPRETAESFKVFLRKANLRYEPSECGNLIHFEVYADPAEVKAADAFLKTL